MQSGEPGFTLVELVVVIAILGILGGVGTVGYSGYIKSARTKADQQLIASVNESFASGCLDAGVEVSTVTDAKISVSDQKIFGISSVKSEEHLEGVPVATLDKISGTFNMLFEGNFDTAFVTENVKSLYWDPEENSFKMDFENSVDARIMLSNGKSVLVSAEVMDSIMNSAYADMGYAEIAATIDNLSGSSATLAQVAGGLGMMDRLTAVMLANGLISNDKASSMASDLSIANALRNPDAYSAAANEAANGLQMVTAKYLAGATEEDIDFLLNNVPLNTTTSMLTNMAGDTGGTRTVAAAALQYALVESFAENENYKDTQVSYTVREGGFMGFGGTDVTYTMSVGEFLNSDYAKDDPIKALATVQATEAYGTYKNDEQYKKDVNGFVGTMSLLGDNVGSVDRNGNVNKEGAINPDDYMSEGIHGDEATEILSAVIGK
ncbi:MAG: prepilin-type N-terminal cleavage/methylation domain-containing protein [Firmicutes bacterium]|nr:prepilin-type N-terminal cleavage/methylation domain-containing protein [Bacillota bacterium]